MRKLYVLPCTLLACLCAGCGDDYNERLISEAINKLKDTTSNMEQVAKIVNDASSQARKDAKPLAVDKILLATAETEKMKKNAQALQEIKARTELRKDNITPDQREEYTKKHKSAFQAAMIEVDAAQKRMDAALKDADTLVAEMPEGSEERAKAATAMENLRKKVKEALDEFEGLTKRQT